MYACAVSYACQSISYPRQPRAHGEFVRVCLQVCDYGLPQNTATEALKHFVLNDPVVVGPPNAKPKPLFSLTKGPTGACGTVHQLRRPN